MLMNPLFFRITQDPIDILFQIYLKCKANISLYFNVQFWFVLGLKQTNLICLVSDTFCCYLYYIFSLQHNIVALCRKTTLCRFLFLIIKPCGIPPNICWRRLHRSRLFIKLLLRHVPSDTRIPTCKHARNLRARSVCVYNSNLRTIFTSIQMVVEPRIYVFKLNKKYRFM